MCHNVSKKVLLTEPKLSKNSKPFWSILPGRVTEIYPLSKDEGLKYKLYSMSMELDTRKSNFGSQQWLWFHIGSWWRCTTKFNKCYHKAWQLFHYKMRQTFITIYIRFLESVLIVVSYLLHDETVLQNSTNIITKCDSYFITKCDKHLLQYTSGFFTSKCNSFIVKCDRYYKMQRFRYKIWQLLQNTTFMHQCTLGWRFISIRRFWSYENICFSEHLVHPSTDDNLC